MDGSRFDELTRSFTDSLSGGTTRRSLGQLLAGSALGSLLTVGIRTTDAKRKKKKRKKKKTGAQPSASPGCTPNCDGKECGPDGCGSVCGSCAAVNQVCDAGQCACPTGLPDTCGRACLAACPAGYARNPETCICCIRHGLPSGGDASNCCSGLMDETSGNCVGKRDWFPCDYDFECDTDNCVDGRCSSCRKGQNWCRFGDTDRCRFSYTGNGVCLTSIDGSTRCGDLLDRDLQCIAPCSSNAECEEALGPAAFCARRNPSVYTPCYPFASCYNSDDGQPATTRCVRSGDPT